MAVEGAVKTLFEELKYRLKFPPRERIPAIKNEFASRGMGQSSGLAQTIAGEYLKVIEPVLDQFTEQLIEKRVALGLGSEESIRRALNDAHQRIFDEARGMVLDDLVGLGDYRAIATQTIDGEREPVWTHLERVLALAALGASERHESKEYEQKFGILLSPGQASKDFATWRAEAEKWGNSVVLLFIDVDHFKALNERLTHAKVDQTILPGVQRILAKLIHGRGEGYRYGGEEFLLMLLNLDDEEAKGFAEKVRKTIEDEGFRVDDKTEQLTISIGVASWPANGTTYQEVLEAANRAETEAKKTRNTVKVAAPIGGHSG